MGTNFKLLEVYTVIFKKSSKLRCNFWERLLPENTKSVTTPYGSRAEGFWNDAAVSSHGF
jgi:hypothetical protein